MNLMGGSDCTSLAVGETVRLNVTGGTGERTVAGQPGVMKQAPAQLDLRRRHEIVGRHSRRGKTGREFPCPPRLARGAQLSAGPDPLRTRQAGDGQEYHCEAGKTLHGLLSPLAGLLLREADGLACEFIPLYQPTGETPDLLRGEIPRTGITLLDPLLHGRQQRVSALTV